MKRVPSVQLKIRIRKGPREYRYVDPVWKESRSKKIKARKLKPLFATVNGNEEEHPEGTYALRYKNNWKNLGPDAEVAVLAFERFQAELSARAAGANVLEESFQDSVLSAIDKRLEQVIPAISPKASGLFTAKVEEFLIETKALKKKRTFSAYRLCLQGFEAACKTTHPNDPGLRKLLLKDLNRDDVLKFMLTLKAKHSERTVVNRVANLHTFYLHCDLPWPIAQKDMPKYTDKLVKVYEEHRIQVRWALRP